jgi:hypothetical protein
MMVRPKYRNTEELVFAVIESLNMNKLLLAVAILLFSAPLLSAKVVRKRDIFYQKLEGVALTMDVFVPENPYGIGVIKIVSGGWKSGRRKIKQGFYRPHTDHAYTVFAVAHGSQSRFEVRDIMTSCIAPCGLFGPMLVAGRSIPIELVSPAAVRAGI